MTIATLRPKAVVPRNRLKQRGFPAAVLPRKEHDARAQIKLGEPFDRRNREQINTPVLDSFVQQSDFLLNNSWPSIGNRVADFAIGAGESSNPLQPPTLLNSKLLPRQTTVSPAKLHAQTASAKIPHRQQGQRSLSTCSSRSKAPRPHSTQQPLLSASTTRLSSEKLQSSNPLAKHRPHRPRHRHTSPPSPRPHNPTCASPSVDRAHRIWCSQNPRNP